MLHDLIYNLKIELDYDIYTTAKSAFNIVQST